MPVEYRYHQDTRDGTIYNCVLMPDGKWWSVENLRWAGAGRAYNDSPANEAIYGRLYTWEEANTGCPPGTHLPSDAEWTALETAIPNPDGTKLKASSSLWTTNTGTDDYGFAALPGGRLIPVDQFDGISAGCWLWTSTHYGSDNAWTRFLDKSYSDMLRGTDYDQISYSVRFIVDTFNEPWPVKLFGVNFDGFERGMTVTLKRPINVVDSIGGPPRLIPYGPAILDEWRVETELWVNAERAAELEAAVPPYGVPTDSSMRLPARGGVTSFPGLLPALAGADADRYDYAQVTRFEGQGRKGPALDLHGYFLYFTLRCWGGNQATNPATATTTTAPAWLAQKFAARQLQDWSSQEVIYTAGGAVTTYARSKHGRRKDVNLNLDHLTASQADELVGLFRGVRHNAVTVTLDNGADGQQSVSVHLLGLQLHRTGLHWDGTLETVLA